MLEALEGRVLLSGWFFEVARGRHENTVASLRNFFSPEEPVRAGVRTWVLIHGYLGNGHTAGLTRIAETLQSQYPSDQVLTLDWSHAAKAPTYQDAEQWLPLIGAAAAKDLAGFGLASGDLNLIGYSFGTYVADELAAHVPGGVNTIAAIDPPAYVPDGPGSFDPEAEVDFSAHSLYSWSFHDAGAGGLGDAVTPATASEAIDVVNTTHGGIIGVFADAIRNTDAASQQFHLWRLLAHDPGPWRYDQFDPHAQPVGKYEAVLDAATGRLSFFDAAGQETSA